MKINQNAFTFVLGFLLFVSACAQENSLQFDRQKLDKFLSLVEENDKGMGSLSIFQDGKEVYQKTIGHANKEKNIKATPETVYRIGSISKTFTATLVMMLVEEGKLSLDQKLSDFYPDIANAADITIEMMLRHRSGIFSLTDESSYTLWMEKPITKEEQIAKISAYDSAFEPDSKSAYSNSNYVLLTFIVEEVTNKSFTEVIQNRIFDPLDLSLASYGQPLKGDGSDALSYYRGTEWELASLTDPSVPRGAGAINATPTELNLFLDALFNEKLVSQQSLDMMMEIKEGYGIGLIQVPFYEKKAYGHTGGIDGFQSNAFYFPKEKVSIAYVANGIVMPRNDIMIGVLSIYFGKDYELPDFKPAMVFTSEELEPYLGVYSSPTFPLKVTITKDGTTLIGQATGQSSFPLQAVEQHKFKFDQAGLVLEFDPEKETMILKQGGGEFALSRE
ncbi:MAG: serine hydrolase domain-containing protein [Marinoscillum sp.]